MKIKIAKSSPSNNPPPNKQTYMDKSQREEGKGPGAVF